jgi:hypothetical protein
MLHKRLLTHATHRQAFPLNWTWKGHPRSREKNAIYSRINTRLHTANHAQFHIQQIIHNPTYSGVNIEHTSEYIQFSHITHYIFHVQQSYARLEFHIPPNQEPSHNRANTHMIPGCRLIAKSCVRTIGFFRFCFIFMCFKKELCKCRPPEGSCHMSNVKCYMSHVTCHISPGMLMIAFSRFGGFYIHIKLREIFVCDWGHDNVALANHVCMHECMYSES